MRSRLEAIAFAESVPLGIVALLEAALNGLDKCGLHLAGAHVATALETIQVDLAGMRSAE